MKYDIDNLYSYKGYPGSIEYDLQGKVFHGKIIGIRSSISYEAEDINALKAAFEEAVDDYLIVCEAEGFKPEMPNRVPLGDVKIPFDIFKRLYEQSASQSKTPSETVEEALLQYFTA